MILLLNILTTLYACVLVGQAVRPTTEALLSIGGIVHPDCGHQLGVMRARNRMPHPGGSREHCWDVVSGSLQGSGGETLSG